jgi:RNA-splicing ligase RtcB
MTEEFVDSQTHAQVLIGGSMGTCSYVLAGTDKGGLPPC